MGTLAQNGFSNFDCTHFFLNNSDIFLLVIYHFVNFELILCLEDLCLMFFAIFNFQVKIINKPFKAKKNIPLLTITCKKIMSRSVGKTFHFYLFIYLFFWLERKKLNTCFIYTKHLRLKRLTPKKNKNNNTSQNRFTFSFKNCFQRLSFWIEHNSNLIEHIHSNAKQCCYPDESGRNRNNIPIYEF